MKPDWTVAVRAEGSFTGAGGPAGYLYAIVDARTFSGYAQHLSEPGPAVPLRTLGPLAALAGGQPSQQQ